MKPTRKKKKKKSMRKMRTWTEVRTQDTKLFIDLASQSTGVFDKHNVFFLHCTCSPPKLHWISNHTDWVEPRCCGTRAILNIRITGPQDFLPPTWIN